MRGHAVVVALADGIELVIVAARAADRQSEERGADGVHRVGLPFGAELVAVVGELDGEGADREQAGADAAVDVLLFFLGQLDVPSRSMLVDQSSSAAICSCTKVLYGLSELNDAIT